MNVAEQVLQPDQLVGLQHIPVPRSNVLTQQADLRGNIRNRRVRDRRLIGGQPGIDKVQVAKAVHIRKPDNDRRRGPRRRCVRVFKPVMLDAVGPGRGTHKQQHVSPVAGRARRQILNPFDIPRDVVGVGVQRRHFLQQRTYPVLRRLVHLLPGNVGNGFVTGVAPGIQPTGHG